MFIVYDGVPTFKLLGVWQQENLRWNHHINETVKKANQRLHYLRDCRKAQLPPDVHGHYSIQYEDPPTVRIIRLSSMGRWIPRLPRKGNQASSEQKSRHHRRPQGHASSNRTKRRRDEAAKVELQRILADKKTRTMLLSNTQDHTILRSDRLPNCLCHSLRQPDFT